MVDADEELFAGVVFRLAKVGPRFPPESRKALSAHFEFSTADREEAAERRKWWLSVWDIARTAPAQVRAQLESQVGTTYIPFRLNVADVRSVKLEDPPGIILRVFRDPLRESFAGSEGHCGIDG